MPPASELGAWGPWVALGALGAYHGLNPGMGWLFAVALGLQERRRRAVVRALVPIALGHEAAILPVVLLVGGLQLVAAPALVRAAGAVALVAFGAYKFLRPRSHPRWVGMRLGWRDLVFWSFLMSTAHGAGLMLFPILLGLPAPAHALDLPGVEPSVTSLLLGGAATLVHAGAMLLAMAAVAVLVYEKLGVGILRRAWVNVDVLWAIAVMAAGAFTLFTQ